MIIVVATLLQLCVALNCFYSDAEPNDCLKTRTVIAFFQFLIYQHNALVL